jgi:hypothetical protein
MGDNTSNTGIVVLLEHVLYIFRQAEAENALNNKTTVLIRIQRQRIHIPKKMF